jgi:hypothetical protein
LHGWSLARAGEPSFLSFSPDANWNWPSNCRWSRVTELNLRVARRAGSGHKPPPSFVIGATGPPSIADELPRMRQLVANVEGHPRQHAAGALQFSMRTTPIAKTFAAEIEDIEPLAKLSGRCSRVACWWHCARADGLGLLDFSGVGNFLASLDARRCFRRRGALICIRRLMPARRQQHRVRRHARPL